MLDQAVQAFGQRIGITSVQRRNVKRNIVDVETDSEVVRIIESNGIVKMTGWRKDAHKADKSSNRSYRLVTGIWSATRGWLYTELTYSAANYRTLRSILPKE